MANAPNSPSASLAQVIPCESEMQTCLLGHFSPVGPEPENTQCLRTMRIDAEDYLETLFGDSHMYHMQIVFGT